MFKILRRKCGFFSDLVNYCEAAKFKDFEESKCHKIIKGCQKTTVVSVAQQIGLAVSASINNLSYEALKSIKAVY